MCPKLWSENKKDSPCKIDGRNYNHQTSFEFKSPFHPPIFLIISQSITDIFRPIRVDPFLSNHLLRFYFSKGGKWPLWHLENKQVPIRILSLGVLEENIRICFFNQDFVILQIFSNKTNSKQEKIRIPCFPGLPVLLSAFVPVSSERRKKGYTLLKCNIA